MLDFRAPKDDPFVIGFCKLMVPAILKFRLSNAEVRVVGDGLERFKKLKGKHTMICPNHSFRHDPEVMFAFSNMAGESFNFIAAREVFDWNNGINGWFLQRMGVYSVVRGAVDRESFKTTKSILAEGKKKLVLFPEGEISWQNEKLLPLETGACQLSFWALDELHKSKPEESVYIQPIALKYTYKHNILPELEWCLTKLENRLGIDGRDQDSLYERVRAAAKVVLATLERQYHCKPGPEATLNDRMMEVKTQALKQMAEVLDIQLPALKHSHLDWVRVLRNHMDDFIYSGMDNLTEYERKIHEEKAARVKTFYRDLDRVVSFISIYDGYLSPPATQERLAAVIEMLENEVFGEKSVKGARLILVDVGQPISLLEFYEEYKKNKRAVIDNVSNQLSSQIHGMLEALDKDRQPVYVS